MTMKQNKIDTAVILVGGKGLRLENGDEKQQATLTKVRGEPFLKIALTPLLERFARVILATYHKADSIVSFLGSYFPNNPQISVYLGRKEGIAATVEEIMHTIQTPFTCVNGNILYDPVLLKILEQEYTSIYPLSVVAVSPINSAPSHAKIIIKQGQKIRMARNNEVNSPECYTSMGAYVVDPRISVEIDELSWLGDFDTLYPALLKHPFGLRTAIYENPWFVLHSRIDIAKIEYFLKSKRNV
ncbi:hypothetical protein HY373_01720 [Candidatus Berkelbacteria bacterium]|nr:hypothetical protein [Candidatus Berkelbacteria bacterium]